MAGSLGAVEEAETAGDHRPGERFAAAVRAGALAGTDPGAGRVGRDGLACPGWAFGRTGTAVHRSAR